MRIWAKPELKVIRAKKGYTSAALAAAIDRNRPYWTRIENGKQPTSPTTAKLVCEVLGAEFDELFSIEDH